MNQQWHLIQAIILLIAGAGILFFRLQHYSRDVKSLKLALRQALRGKIFRRSVRFHNNDIRSIWNTIQVVASQQRSSEQKTERFTELVTATTGLAVANSDSDATAAETLRLIKKQAGLDAVAGAVILDRTAVAKRQILTSFGIPHSRLEGPLLIAFDAAIDGILNWGYVSVEDNKLLDFSVFGIGASLLIPFGAKDQVVGCLWIGLRQGSGISPSRRVFLQAISEHAAASFYAAERVNKRVEQSAKERDFLVGMSHDLRAPGNSALYALRDILSGEMGALSTDQHLRLQIVEDALEDQLGILGDVIDFARHQKGFLEVKPSAVPIKPAINRVMEQFKLSASRKGLTVEIDSLPDSSVEVDSRHFQRILANLISNAVKYTDQGSVRVSAESSGRTVTIIVADTGIGVPDDEQHLLFTEFARSTNSGGRAGTGLGLALVRALVELNHGVVFFRPNKPSGSVFGVRLNKVERSSAHIPNLPSILVVDDDPATCRTNIRHLRELTEQIVPATSVAEAKELLALLKPSLLITDFQLSDGTASNLLEYLDVLQLPTKVILLTGSANPKVKQALTGNNKALVLEKPASQADLVAAIQALFYQTEQQPRLVANS